MPATYEPIATTTLGSSQASVTFSSIPSTYTDLIFVAWTKPYTSSEGSIKLNYNSDTGSNYSYTLLTADPSTVSAAASANTTSVAISSGNALNNPRQPIYITHIFNYANTSVYKTSITRTSEGGSASYVDAWVNTWRSTSAITSITVNVTYIFNIGAGSTFTLYGVKAA